MIAKPDYEATMEVDRNELTDDQIGLRISELLQRALTHKDYLIVQFLIAREVIGNN